MSTEGRQQAHAVDALFRKTPYAVHLKEHPRYSKYQPEGIDASTWRNILHTDSDGLDQTRLMLHLTETFLRYDTDNSAQLSDEEKDLLFLAMAIQNWGKSFSNEQSPGVDISYEHLTSTEIEARRSKLHSLIDELLPELGVKERFIIERTVYDRTTKLGQVFDAIRRLNCLRTGLLAYDTYTENPDEAGYKNLSALSIGVLSNQLPYLITYAEKYTPVNEALERSKEAIQVIFNDKSLRDHELVEEQQTAERIERTEMIWNRSHGEKSEIGSERKRPKDDTLFSQDSLFEKRFINEKEKLGQIIESLRLLGMKITLTSGSFDLLHVGHAKYLERASEYGDILVVGVDSDNKIKQRKGPSRPVVGEEERLRLLSHIRGVDILTLKEPDEKKWGLIQLVRPDTLIVTAETYTTDEIKELERLYCKRVVVLEPQATTSTGAQIRRIQIGEKTVITEAIQEICDEEGVSEEVRRELGRVLGRLTGGN